MKLFTTNLLKGLEDLDENYIKNLFNRECGLDGTDPLPRPCLDKEVCYRTFNARAEMMGRRLRNLPHGSITVGKKLAPSVPTRTRPVANVAARKFNPSVPARL